VRFSLIQPDVGGLVQRRRSRRGETGRGKKEYAGAAEGVIVMCGWVQEGRVECLNQRFTDEARYRRVSKGKGLKDKAVCRQRCG
jgi:hypothetical protein